MKKIDFEKLNAFERWKAEDLGYSVKTSFWVDFCLADKFGKEEIKRTFDCWCNLYKTHCTSLTELVLVLNWRSFKYCEIGNKELGELYSNLWRIASKYAIDFLKNEELSYFIEVMDKYEVLHMKML